MKRKIVDMMGEEKSAKIRIFAGDCVEKKKPAPGPKPSTRSPKPETLKIFAGDCVEKKKPSPGPGGFEGSGCAVSGFLFRV
jgi:hypothetical protein